MVRDRLVRAMTKNSGIHSPWRVFSIHVSCDPPRAECARRVVLYFKGNHTVLDFSTCMLSDSSIVTLRRGKPIYLPILTSPMYISRIPPIESTTSHSSTVMHDQCCTTSDLHFVDVGRRNFVVVLGAECWGNVNSCSFFVLHFQTLSDWWKTAGHRNT